MVRFHPHWWHYAMANPLETPPLEPEQSCATEDQELRVRKSPVDGIVKNYTRTKKTACEQTASDGVNTFGSNKCLTDMLLSSTPNKTESSYHMENAEVNTRMLFTSFDIPQPIYLPCSQLLPPVSQTDNGQIQSYDCDIDPTLEAMLHDAQNQIERLLAEKSSTVAQNDLLNPELDKYKKIKQCSKSRNEKTHCRQ